MTANWRLCIAVAATACLWALLVASVMTVL